LAGALSRAVRATLRGRRDDGNRHRPGLIRIPALDSIEPAKAGIWRSGSESSAAQLSTHRVPGKLRRRLALRLLEQQEDDSGALRADRGVALRVRAAGRLCGDEPAAARDAPD